MTPGPREGRGWLVSPQWLNLLIRNGPSSPASPNGEMNLLFVFRTHLFAVHLEGDVLSFGTDIFGLRWHPESTCADTLPTLTAVGSTLFLGH